MVFERTGRFLAFNRFSKLQIMTQTAFFYLFAERLGILSPDPTFQIKSSTADGKSTSYREFKTFIIKIIVGCLQLQTLASQFFHGA